MHKTFLVVSVFLYCVSLFLPALYTTPSRQPYEYDVLCRNMQAENTPERILKRNGVEMVCFLDIKGNDVQAKCTYDPEEIVRQRIDPKLTELHGNAAPCKVNEVPTRRAELGVEVLLFGIMAVITMQNFAWLANLVYLLSFTIFRYRKSALTISIFGFLLALDTFRLSSLMGTDGVMFDKIGIGFYVWISAMLSQIAYFYYRPTLPAKEQPASAVPPVSSTIPEHSTADTH